MGKCSTSILEKARLDEIGGEAVFLRTKIRKFGGFFGDESKSRTVWESYLTDFGLVSNNDTSPCDSNSEDLLC